MQKENPIYVESEGEYDYSVSCERNGLGDAPWTATVKITRGPDHDVALGRWESPSGYATYEDGKRAGIEAAVSLIRQLEAGA